MQKKALITLLLFFVLSSKVVAQIRYDIQYQKACQDGEECVRKQDLKCAEDNFNFALSIAVQEGFTDPQASNGLKKVERLRLRQVVGRTNIQNRNETVVLRTEVRLRPHNTPDDPNDWESERAIAAKYNEYQMIVKYPFQTGTVLSDDTIFTFINASYYHSWSLMNHKKYAAAENVLQYVLDNMNQYDTSSKKILYALSGIYNGLNKLEEEGNNDMKASMANARLAISFGRKALEADKDNDKYMLRLANNLRNMCLFADSLSPTDKKRLEEEYRAIANEVAGKTNENAGTALQLLSSSLIDESYSLAAAGKTEEFISRSGKLIQKINQHLQKYPKTSQLILSKSRICNKMAQFVNSYLKDTVRYELYLDQSIKELEKYIRTQASNEVPTDFWFVKDNYNSILDNNSSVVKEDKRMQNYLMLKKLLMPIIRANIEVPELAQMDIKTSLYIADLQLKGKNPDTAAILKTIGDAISIFEKSGLMKNPSYSDDYASYCKMYTIRLKIQAARNNLSAVARDYSELWKRLGPMREKYMFDFYANQHFIKVSQVYGEMLVKNKQYHEAIKPLMFASYEGIKVSTNLLAEIYKTREFYNKDLADSFSARSNSQTDGLKRLPVQVKCGATQDTLYVYVLDKAKGHPYKGIRDQAQWIKQARGCEIPEDIIQIYDQLQEVAWNQNISFQNLCVRYLDYQKEKRIVLDKYNPYKKRINEDTTASFKLISYAKLAGIYNEDIKSDSVNRSVIIEDALPFYFDYYDLLARNDDTLATKIAAVIFRLGFEKNKGDISHLLKTNDVYFLSQYLEFYLEARDTVNVNIVGAKLIERYEADILQEEDKLKEAASSSDIQTIKNTLSQTYNSYGWYCIFLKKFDKLYYLFSKSLEYNGNNLYAKGNMPHAYLFNNQFKKAKGAYLRLKDMPLNDPIFPTFKDAFIDDFKKFRQAGLMSDDINKISKLLD